MIFMLYLKLFGGTEVITVLGCHTRCPTIWRKLAARGVFKLFSTNLIKNIENGSLFSAFITLSELYLYLKLYLIV